MRENATQEAARIIREAEGRAELVTQKAQAAHEDAQREIDALRMKRREAEASLESIIAALHNTLEFIREQERPDLRVVPHRALLEAAARQVVYAAGALRKAGTQSGPAADPPQATEAGPAAKLSSYQL